MGYRLLMVGDDQEFARTLCSCAGQAEYSLQTVRTGTEGMKWVLEERVDLAILDLNLADMEGLAWLKMVRQTSEGQELPVVIVSEHRTEAQLCAAFEAGADEFILKDCSLEEMAARLRVVLRRRFEREERQGYPMALGPLELDPSRHECRVRGRKVDLKPREFELLEILMRKAGRVLSRAYLLETVWGMSRLANSRAVDVGMSRLRETLGRRASRWIETVEGYGYRFRA